MVVTLSGKIIIIAAPSVMGFEGVIQIFEVAAIAMNVNGTVDIDKEHCSFISWLF